MLGSAILIRAQQANSLLVIEGARLIDGTGRPPLENAVVVIANGGIYWGQGFIGVRRV